MTVPAEAVRVTAKSDRLDIDILPGVTTAIRWPPRPEVEEETVYWCQEGHTLTQRTLSAEFPGTLIQVKLLVRDDVTYSFADEGGSHDAYNHRC